MWKNIQPLDLKEYFRYNIQNSWIDWSDQELDDTQFKNFPDYIDYINRIFPKSKDFIYLDKLIKKLCDNFEISKNQAESIIDALKKEDLLFIAEDNSVTMNIMLNTTRKSIFDLIEKYPGIYPKAIKDFFSIGNNQLMYHIGILLTFNKIISIKFSNMSAFGLPNSTIEEIKLGALIFRNKLRELIRFLLSSSEGKSIRELMDIFSIPKGTLQYFMNDLISNDYVIFEVKGQLKLYSINPNHTNLLKNTLKKYDVLMARKSYLNNMDTL